MSNESPVIGVTLGDATGIGPELIVKTFQDNDIQNLATWVIVGDKRVLAQGESITGLKINTVEIDGMDQVEKKNGAIYFKDLANLDPNDYEVGKLSPVSGKITGETLKYVLDLSKEKKIDGVMYGPLNKEALHRGGHHFKDELHFFAKLLDCKDGFSEINYMNGLWVTRVTSHIPLKNVSENITKQKVVERIRFAHNTLTEAGLDNPKLVVSALNPHAGDGGLLGNEEIDYITPAINEMKEEGVNVDGPYPADTLFLRLEKDPFDCLLAMYHDQAQTGMKLLGFNRGVTMSGGLPITLTTPAHGTAFDIAGKGTADEGATKEALKMAVRMNKTN
jgi:4-hydroxythreonine-4-phosphate dehydrogenase